MAIGRISGSVLKSNLTRNGVDLAFETNLLYLDVTNNRVGIGTSEPNTALHVVGNTTMTGTLDISGALTFAAPIALTVGSDPTTLVNTAHIYAKDESASAEVFVRDEAGNITKISPHNAQGEWEYYSRNTKTGKIVRVNMEEMIRDIEKITGKNYIKNE